MANFNYGSLMFFTQLSSSATLATSAAASVYANPSTLKTYVNEIELHNTTGATVSAALFLVPNNASNLGTVTSFTEFAKVIIQPWDTIYIQPKSPYVLTTLNDAIFGVATGSGVNAQVRGMLYS